MDKRGSGHGLDPYGQLLGQLAYLRMLVLGQQTPHRLGQLLLLFTEDAHQVHPLLGRQQLVFQKARERLAKPRASRSTACSSLLASIACNIA